MAEKDRSGGATAGAEICRLEWVMLAIEAARRHVLAPNADTAVDASEHEPAQDPEAS